ncbi:MAG: peptidoglycan-associated lipoprotein Pal [Gallionella sp.]|nr:peptidoglycan-associated lipoprotein Pal [Gallionella sp.]MDH4286677.1 peptidoglycan-associated lipoprotein Pal [Gallionella sp.]
MKKTAAILVSIMLAACASTPKTETSQESENTNKAIAASTSEATINSASKTNVSESAAEAGKAAAEQQEMLKQSVFFEFDSFDIRPEYRNIVLKQAEHLKKYKKGVVTLEGNCDERGSNEYNLALGNMRANATRKSLVLLGVPAAQIKAVSLGEENPKLLCHDEECWKENRRTDFIHNLN